MKNYSRTKNNMDDEYDPGISVGNKSGNYLTHPWTRARLKMERTPKRIKEIIEKGSKRVEQIESELSDQMEYETARPKYGFQTLMYSLGENTEDNLENEFADVKADLESGTAETVASIRKQLRGAI